MSNDYRVSSLSDQRIYEIAGAVRKYFGIPVDSIVDIIDLISRGSVRTSRGVIKSVVLKRLIDSELGEDDARTIVNGNTIIIEVKESVFDKARWGEGRARMTLAHELGHAVMHEKTVPLARATIEGKKPGYVLRRKEARVCPAI